MEITLIKSSSYRLLNQSIDQITKDVMNKTVFSLNEVSIQEVIDDASYFGLFDERRAIIVKDVKLFGGKFAYEEESNALLKFLQSVKDDTIFVFICDDIKKTKDLTKNVIGLGAKVIDISNIDDAKFNELIAHYTEEEGILLDDKARDMIKKNVLSNIDIAIQEIDKIRLVDQHITVDLVNQYGSSEDDDETFAFSNAVIAKDFKSAFSILEILLKQGVEVNALVGILASSFSNMFMVKEAVNHGMDDETIAKTLGYSGTGRVYVMKKNARIYTLEQLKDILLALSTLDIKIKTGANPVYGLKEFLLDL